MAEQILEEQPLRPRRPYIAGILAFLCPGLGHLYNARPWRTLFYALTITGAFLALRLFANRSAFALYAGFFTLMFVFVTSVFDAVLIASKPVNRTFQWYQRWYIYLGFYLIGIFGNQSLIGPISFVAFHVPTASMTPTLFHGDKIIIDRSAYLHQKPEIGDVVAFRYPKNEEYFYLKRIVGLPGDWIEFKGKQIVRNGTIVEQVAINDKVLERVIPSISQIAPGNLEIRKETLEKTSYIVALDKSSQILEAYERKVVPLENYFVVGDNRDYSNDSRFWGFVPEKNIYGKASYVFFSKTPEKFDILWDRIGLKIF